jgi:hypothetical protein
MAYCQQQQHPTETQHWRSQRTGTSAQYQGQNQYTVRESCLSKKVWLMGTPAPTRMGVEPHPGDPSLELLCEIEFGRFNQTER